MKKYIFTKSMSRLERADLCRKLYTELEVNKRFLKVYNDLVNLVKSKKKKALFGSNTEEAIYALKTYNFKGLELYIIINSTEGSDIIFNTSPIDASYSEFIRVIPNGNTVLYTQHLLDRYNERVHNFKYTNHKDLIKRFSVNNAIKASIAKDKGGTNKVSQRVSEGFIMGVYEDNSITMNTFYDNEEYKDSEIKGRTRAIHSKNSKLSDKDLAKFYKLQDDFSKGWISLEDYEHQILINNYI